MDDERELDGKVALVTGGASGIGLAAAQLFAEKGAAVVIADFNGDGAEQAAARICAAGGRAMAVRADVTQAAQVEALLDKAIERFGRLDFAHNNAGGGSTQAMFEDTPEDYFDFATALNLKSVWLAMRGQLPLMVRQGGGSIVNTSSVAGVTACPNNAAYSAAKHGVIGLSKTAAIEYAGFNIRVNAVCPGLTETPLTKGLGEADPALMAKLLPPLGRMAQPREIAEAVVWLCSDRASFVTGHAMIVDGGHMARA